MEHFGVSNRTGAATDEGPDSFYCLILESFWFRLEGDSQNIVSVGDVLTVKRDDANGPVGASTACYGRGFG